MKRIALIACVVAGLVVSGPAFAKRNSATASVGVSAGKMLYDSKGHRVGTINRVTADGSAQVILNGRLVTIPASTLSQANGKVTTSLSRAEIGRTP